MRGFLKAIGFMLITFGLIELAADIETAEFAWWSPLRFVRAALIVAALNVYARYVYKYRDGA